MQAGKLAEVGAHTLWCGTEASRSVRVYLNTQILHDMSRAQVYHWNRAGSTASQRSHRSLVLHLQHLHSSEHNDREL